MGTRDLGDGTRQLYYTKKNWRAERNTNRPPKPRRRAWRGSTEPTPTNWAMGRATGGARSQAKRGRKRMFKGLRYHYLGNSFKAVADKKGSTNLRVAGGECGAGSEGLTPADERLKVRRADASKNNVPTALPKHPAYRAGAESL